MKLSFAVSVQLGDLAPRGEPDGQITLADYLILKQALNDTLISELTPDEVIIANVAPLGAVDNELNLADLLIIKRAMLNDIVLPVLDMDVPLVEEVITPPVYAPVGDISGTLDNITLAADTTYTVISNIMIPENSTLTIEPGAILKFSNNTTLIVNGAINAQGTVDAPIQFIGSVDGSTALKDWYGIEITDGSSPSILTHIEIANAEHGLQVNNSPLTLSYSDFHHNFYGIQLNNVSSATIDNNHLHDMNYSSALELNNSHADISNNHIHAIPRHTGVSLVNSSGEIRDNHIHNTRTGIALGDSSPEITGNTLEANITGLHIANQSSPVINGANKIINNNTGITVLGHYSNTDEANNPGPVIQYNTIDNTGINYYANTFVNANSVTLDARYNWWGTTALHTIATKLRDHQDNLTKAPWIDFSSFLISEEGEPDSAEFLGGVVNEDMTLPAGQVYRVMYNLQVASGKTLTIEAGSILHFPGTAKLTVNGAINAQGTVDAPIQFIGAVDGSTALKDWYGIEITDGSSPSILTHIEVANAEHGLQVNNSPLTLSYSDFHHNFYGIQLNNVSSATIDNNHLHDMNYSSALELNNSHADISNNHIHAIPRHTGVSLVDSSGEIRDNHIHNTRTGIALGDSSPEITGNTLEANTTGLHIANQSSPVVNGANKIINNNTGITVFGHYSNTDEANNPGPVIQYNTIDNISYNYYANTFANAASVTLDARYNWWGTTALHTIAAKLRDHQDNITKAPWVDFSSFLVSEGGRFTTDTFLNLPITENTTLTQGTTYLIPGNINIPAGVTLTIEQGVTLKMVQGAKITIEGGLLVNGTAADKVRFTPAFPTGAYDWQGIHIKPAATNVNIQYALIESAVNGLYFEQAGGLIQNSQFHANQTALVVQNGASPQILNNIISENLNGITLKRTGGGANPTPEIRANNIENNSSANVILSGILGTTPFAFDENWWGTDNIDDIRATISGSNQTALVTLDNISSGVHNYSGIVFQNVSYNQSSFKPSFNETFKITFNLQTPATVYLRWFPESGSEMVVEVSQIFSSAGEHEMEWDGKNFNGDYLPDDAYHFELFATNGSASELYNAGGYQELTRTQSVFKHYAPHQNKYVKFYINNEKPLHATIKDSKNPLNVLLDRAIGIGEHTFLWDIRDTSGRILANNVTSSFTLTTRAIRNASVVIEAVSPKLFGTGVAPNIEIQSDPYRVIHSYNQIAQVFYQIDQDARAGSYL